MTKKLALNRETLRRLDNNAIRGVQGAQPPETQTCECPTGGCTLDCLTSECRSDPTIGSGKPTCTCHCYQ